MGEKFRKVLVSLLVVGQLSLAPMKSLAEEVKSFKNYSEQNKSMPVLKEQPKFSSVSEVKKEIDFLMEQKDAKIPKKIKIYSDYQKGQIAAHLLFDFYRMSMEDRAESEKGKKLYTILAELYYHKDNKGFQTGFGEEAASKLEKKDPDAYMNFLSMFSEYESYYAGEEEAGRTPLAMLNYLLEGYDQKEAMGFVPKPAKAMSLLAVVTDKTLNDFIGEFSKEYSSLPREEAVELLVNSFMYNFNTNEENAKMILKAVLYTYSSLEAGERKMFIHWFKNINEKQRIELLKEVEKTQNMKKTTLPTAVVKEMFQEVKTVKEDKAKYEEELKKELDAYPGYIREADMKKLTKTFKFVPNGYLLDKLLTRLEYIEKKIEYLEIKSKPKPKEKEELKELEKEIKYLDKWLDQFEITGLTPKEKLVKINAGFLELQANYIMFSQENTELVPFLTKTEPPALKDLYFQYFIGLDAVSGRIFMDMDSTGDVEKQMYKITKEKFSKTNIENAWFTFYSNYFEKNVPIGQEDPITQNIYSYMGGHEGMKSPMMMVAFQNYYEQVENISGVGSPEEKTLVFKTSTKLLALHPLLVIKYFNAMAHLADLCEGNPDVYLHALIAVSARVDSATSAAFSPETGFQMGAPPMSKAVATLSNGFDGILAIDEGSLSQYNKYDLVNNNLYIDDFTNVITQKPPGYIPQLTQGKETVERFMIPSPFPPYLYTIPQTTPFTGGMVGVNQQSYEGTLTMPQIVPVWAPSGAQQALGAVKNYLFETHPIMGIGGTIPGTNITGLSETELMKEINSAFVHAEPLDYEKTIIAGGGAGGGAGKHLAEAPDEASAAGLLSFITPTGGVAAGATYTYPDNNIFAGGNAIAMPIGTIKHGAKKGTEVGLETFAGGYQKLEDNVEKLLLESIANTWNPENPSDTFINVNYDKVSQGKAWSSSRLFYVDKNGTVFELKGGHNTMVSMFNFVAGSFDELGKKPVTGVWNYEPKVQTVGEKKPQGTGGFALAFDVGKTSWLFHFQDVPFLTSDTKAAVNGFDQQIAEKRTEITQAELDLEAAIAAGDETEAARLRDLIGSDAPGAETGLYLELVTLQQQKQDYLINEVQQPMLLEWTPGVAWTKEKVKKDKTNVYEITFPGKMLKLQEAEAGEVVGENVYTLQDIVFKIRQIESEKATELTIGMGLGGLEEHWVDEVGNIEGALSLFGRGGFYYKSQAPKASWGLGAYLENTPNFEALAMLSESQETMDYIESLWKVGTTLYGKGETRNNVFLGGLGHFIEQIRPYETEEGEKKWDTQAFYRFVGFIKGVDNVMKIEGTRFEGFEQMMADYEGLMADVRGNPKQAQSYISNFQQKYEDMVNQVFDEYYLGVMLGKNFSLEMKLVFKEEDKKWTGQIPQNIQAKALATWDTGFWRIYASIPTWLPSAVESTTTGPLSDRVGLVGTGFGFDVFNSYFLQRIAFDVGALLAFDEVPTDIAGVMTKDFKKPGAFVESAQMIYSDVIEMSKRYRKLVKKYEKYDAAVEKGNFSKIDQEVLDAMCSMIGEDVISPEVLNKIRKGESAVLTEMQTEALSDALWQWFYDEKSVIEEKFNGKVNVFLAEDAFIFNKDKIYWDVGLFIEYVDAVKAYLILAGREKLGLYTGVDIQIQPEVVLSAFTNVTFEKAPEAAAGLSMKLKAGPGWLSTHFQFKSGSPPVYSSPAYVPYHAPSMYGEKYYEWSLMFYYTIGFGAGTPVQFSPTHSPSTAPKPWWQNY